MLNAINYVKMMIDVGFTREQAETSLNIIGDVMHDNFEKLATKQDLEMLKKELQVSIAELESRLTFRMGTMLVASVGILTALQKLI